MKGVRMRPFAQLEADEESISGLAEWIKRQPAIRKVRWADDVEQRVVARLQRGMRFSDMSATVPPTDATRRIAYERSSHLPEGTVAAFDVHGVLVAMAVL